MVRIAPQMGLSFPEGQIVTLQALLSWGNGVGGPSPICLRTEMSKCRELQAVNSLSAAPLVQPGGTGGRSDWKDFWCHPAGQFLSSQSV